MGSPRNVHIGPRIGPRIGPSGADASVAVPQTTLNVAIADSVDPVITAVNFTFSCVTANPGANDATNVVMVVTLDASLTFVSAVGAGWATGAVGQVVTCTRATLVAGDSKSVIVTVTSGGSALTATTTLDADADNTPPATQDIETTVVKLVDKDATSGWRFPSSATQWSDFNAYHVAIGTVSYPNVAPSALHLMQDASGNPADAIGTFTLTATGTGISYQNAVTGFSRTAINMTSGTTGLLQNVAGGLPSLATQSMLSIFFAKSQAAPAATRDVCLIGAVATRGMMKSILTTGVAQGLFVGNAASGALDAGGAVRPWTIRVNRTASTNTAFTDVDKLAPAFAGTIAGQSISIGNTVSGTSTTQYLYCVHFFLAAGEMSDAGLKALLTAMGPTITWS